MSETNRTTDGERTGFRELYANARRMVASPLLYIGAITVVAAHEIVERLVEWAALSEFYGTLALFPITLALLYGQLMALAYYDPNGHPRGCGTDNSSG